jgi:hypothetical protein
MLPASDTDQKNDSDHRESDRDCDNGQQPARETPSLTDAIVGEALLGGDQLLL